MNMLAVAVPWNQSHYIPWGGFHPLYSGLLDPAYARIDINAWDNVALQELLTSSFEMRQWLLSESSKLLDHEDPLYKDCFGSENRLLTQMLPGDVELFHSVPFPSLTRPFLLHFESLAALLSPWAMDKDTIEEKLPLIREHYRRLLGSPWCLGIFSHQPHALEALGNFLDSPQIESRMFSTSIGLAAPTRRDWQTLPEKPSLTTPGFLFVATPGHFLQCGGHRVLRFWKAFRTAGHSATLCMACERPSPEALTEAGVDTAFIERETGRSIVWASASNAQVEALMTSAHILLQPADTLCTFDILRAMSLGCVPVIAAVQGSHTLLEDNVHGLTVGTESVALHPWAIPARTALEDDRIVEELLIRVPELLTPQQYAVVQSNAHQHAIVDFTAKGFQESFWERVRQLYADNRAPVQNTLVSPVETRDCLLDAKGIHKAFSSTAQPELRINTGLYSVWSQGACYVLLEGCPDMTIQEWSVLTRHGQLQNRQIVMANSLPELTGRYLPRPAGDVPPELSKVVQRISNLLLPFPRLHSRCSQWLRQYRRLRNLLSSLGRSLPEATPDTREAHTAELHLIEEGFHGFNIILYKEHFHAVLQSDGALTAERLDKGLYKKCHSDKNLNVLKQSVIAALAKKDPVLSLETTMQKGKA